ncbi:KCNU1 protein, partial [Anhinga anhinga]|nr:KCNU1 protein [Anhinga anhinga]
ILYLDTVFNAFFLLYFGLRFVAADDKLRFWLELNSLVDFFTIPPVFVSYYLKKNWLGLRFLRALRLLELPRILQFLRITKNNYSIKLSKLFAVFISTWLTAAGFIHLVENNGDPWVQPANSQSLSYFKCMYLVMMTMSTVGYGDVVVQTKLGRTFVIFFIIGGLVLFANFIPEVVEIVESHKNYKSSYEVVSGKNYIVVCGNITLESVTTFLRDFLLQDKGNVCTEILFLGESLPSLELEAVFKCYSAYTTFFYGSALNSEDLKRVGMESANACLILADVHSPQPYTEDTSNIMRVLSIKNHYPNTRVILQIIQSRNKVYLPNIPNWDWRTGDSIICLAALKLGFVAQSCLVPGLSTLLTNLFIVKEDTETKRKYLKDKMLLEDQDYKVMTFQLSNDFADMTFIEVCRLCFVKLNLVLLGIELKFGSQGESAILINPSAQIKLHQNTLGFFIAHSLAEVKRAQFYCKACHSDIQDPEQIKKCQCKSRLYSDIVRAYFALSFLSSNLQPPESCTGTQNINQHDFWNMTLLGIDGSLSTPINCSRGGFGYALSTSVDRWTSAKGPGKRLEGSWPGTASLFSFCFRGFDAQGKENSRVILDSTGTFHWCDAVPLHKALLSCKDQAALNLQDHILVCVFGDATSPLIGLQDFVMPLRASTFIYHELKDIVFLGPLEYLQREWKFIQNFPKLWLFSGSALSCVDLRAVNVQGCAACAILSCNTTASSNPSLVDTESILATLNIRSMQGKSSPAPLECCVLFHCKNIDIRKRYPGNDQTHIQINRCSTWKDVSSLILAFPIESSPNAQFINQAPCGNSDIPELFTTGAPAGTIISDSFLNSLLSMTYYNHHILALLQTLVTSGTSPALGEWLLKEGSGLCRSPDNMIPNASQVRCKLALLPLSKRLLTGAMEDSFGDIYCRALDLFGILCFGLYRLMEEPNPYKNRQASQSSLNVMCYCFSRFVIARPASDLKMLSTDLLFCVVPFN